MSKDGKNDLSLREREIIDLWNSNNLFIGIKNEDDLISLHSYLDELGLYYHVKTISSNIQLEKDDEGYMYICQLGYKGLEKNLNHDESMLKIEDFYTKYIQCNNIIDEMLKIIEEYENR